MLFSIVTACWQRWEERRENRRSSVYFLLSWRPCLPRTRIPAFVDLCRASFYPDPLCIEVLYLAHYLAHPRLQPMVSGGKHSVRNGRNHFFSVVVVLLQYAWMQFFRILPTASCNRFRKENYSFRFEAQFFIIIFALAPLSFTIIIYL